MFEKLSSSQNEQENRQHNAETVDRAEKMNVENRKKIEGLERIIGMITMGKEPHEYSAHDKEDIENIRIRIQEIQESIAENNRTIEKYTEETV